MKKSRKVLLVVGGLVTLLIILLTISALLGDTEKESGAISDIFDISNKVGVVTIEGTITTSDDILKQLRKYRKRPSIKAVVIRINSPGGTVAPAQEIYREIQKLKEKKPVVVSMETVAASAAYYIASSADTIVCSNGTITGSIGVIMMLPDLHKIIEKIGADVNVVKAGKYKDIGSSFRPMTPEERNLLEMFAQDIHEQFITDVAQGRKGKIELNDLRNIADGRFFTGQKAKEMGLVDNIGNFFDAVKIAADAAKIRTEPELVYPKKKWDGVLDIFMESAMSSFLRTSEQIRSLQFPTPTVR